MKAGVASYNIEDGIKAIKRRAAIHSQTKAKQHVLWDEGKQISVKIHHF